MNGLNWDLDELVAAVMADLRKESPASSSGNPSEALTRVDDAPRRTSASDAKVESDVLDVSERILVVETVERIAASSNFKTWRIRKNAVITPAARDELAKRGVVVARGETSQSKLDRVGTTGLKSSGARVTLSASNVSLEDPVGVNRKTSAKIKKSVRVFLATHLPEDERAPSVVVHYLSRNAELVEKRFDCLKKTTQSIADELEANSSLKTVIMTHDSAIASVWANRKHGVRAVVAFSVAQAKRDLQATDANTLIVDPRDLGAYQARQIVDFYTNLK
ncbi:MAG: hypothetical protein ACOX0A_09240 [Thermoguttaceae bacterium]|jgi:ribose 5-phosphate isomerase RpiB